MYGVLLDVSGSMSTTYSLSESQYDVRDVSHRMQRTHAIFTTVSKIAERELAHYKRRDDIFACAFGLREPFEVCDLIELLEKLRDFNASQASSDGRDKLVQLAKQHGVHHAEYWIKEHLSEEVASLLTWQLFNGDKNWLPKLLEKFPNKFKDTAAKLKCKASANLSASPFTQRRQRSEEVQPASPSISHRYFRLFSDDVDAELNLRFNQEVKPSPPPSPLSSAQHRLQPESFSPSPVSPPVSPQQSPILRETHVLEERTMKTSNAYKYILEITSDKSISESFQKSLDKPIVPKSVQHVSTLMRELITRPREDPVALAEQDASVCDYQYIQKLIDKIAPFIYGYTPMCKALNEALNIFKQVDADTAKVLFVLSDGVSTDGDPLPIAQELHALGVCIVTCYLTSDNINSPKHLLYEPNPDWSKGQLVLFKMSSTMKNTHTPVSYLIDAGWELPPSGESHLFLQASSLNIVNELCETVVAHLTESCDALVDVLGKVPLATYINQANASFIPRDQQDEDTCYAHAIAATFHLAMHRIVGREGGIPDFITIYDRLVHEFGKDGANILTVLKKVCPEYRLKFRKVDETGARKAINKRRPVVVTFQLYPEQWKKLEAFFKSTKKKILKRENLKTNEPTHTTKIEEHAVVLIRCDPDCLTFMNSWGTDWADGGFFRVRDQSVLKDTKFYDVYWTKDNLTDSEKQAFKIESTKRAKQIMKEFPSLKDIVYQCPKCNNSSKVIEYSGNLLEAECPRCHQVFKPTNESILESLYTQNMNY